MMRFIIAAPDEATLSRRVRISISGWAGGLSRSAYAAGMFRRLLRPQERNKITCLLVLCVTCGLSTTIRAHVLHNDAAFADCYVGIAIPLRAADIRKFGLVRSTVVPIRLTLASYSCVAWCVV